jgi:amino acid transporter
MSLSEIKRVLIGEPFPTSRDVHERLDPVRALAVFASDPISSNAYATEAIMGILVILGTGALRLTMPLALGIAALVFIVAFSYVQTILHYPDGGGAYTVAKDNLGKWPALLAAGALLTDYILTVSVSVSAGVRAITSAIPELFDERVVISVAFIALLTWLNLRGVRESGTIFAFPTYAFVGGVLIVVSIGVARHFELFGLTALPVHHEVIPPAGGLTQFAYTWLILRAFAAGCTALTGIEAISNGIRAFQPPESKNAAKTMIAMALIAMSLFLGISFVATQMNLVPSHTDSVLSQMTRFVVGDGFLYYWVQFFTMAILVLAANTGFQDFPRLSSYLARDGFLPRWMMNRGDRLVYSMGIFVLAIVASVIVVVFQADEIAMLPLYALGVMVSFTVSQSGMVHLMHRVGKLQPGEKAKTDVTEIHHEKWWALKLGLNAVGAVTTFVVLVVLIATKFIDGAWIIVLAVPLLIWMFAAINDHYQGLAQALSTRDLDAQVASVVKIADVVIVPIGDVHKGSLTALQYALKISNSVRAVCVSTSPEMKERILRRWKRFPEITDHVELVIIDYDFRDIIDPLIDYIEDINENLVPDQYTTVILPEFVSKSTAERLLHNQTARFIRQRLFTHEDIVIINVPYHV